MDIHTIYLDMDGVIVNDLLGLAQRLGVTWEEFHRRREGMKTFDPNFDYVMYQIHRWMRKGEALFVSYPPMDYMSTWHMLIEGWLDKGITVEILSSVTEDGGLQEDIKEQKSVWLFYKGLGHLKKHFCHGSKEKQKWAKEGILLIDDYGRNIREFIEAGGDAIHHTDITTTIKELEVRGLV